MKRILPLAFAATFLVVACGDNASNNTMDDRDEAPISNPSTVETETTYTPADGDVTYREDKVRVWRDGAWVDTEDEVKLDNGAVVYKDGRVKKDDKEIKLEDGEVVNKTGNFFDETGRALEKGWDDVKEGVKEMGNDIEKGANKAGEQIDSDHDNNNDGK